MNMHEMIVQIDRLPERFGTITAFNSRVFAFLLMNISYVSDDIVAVEEFLLTNVAFIITLACMTLHVPSKLCFGVETELTNLKFGKFEENRANFDEVFLTSHFSALKS